MGWHGWAWCIVRALRKSSFGGANGRGVFSMRVRMEAWEKMRDRLLTASAVCKGLGTRLAGCLGNYATFAWRPSCGYRPGRGEIDGVCVYEYIAADG
jgi:hypothetical protein